MPRVHETNTRHVDCCSYEAAPCISWVDMGPRLGRHWPGREALCGPRTGVLDEGLNTRTTASMAVHDTARYEAVRM